MAASKFHSTSRKIKPIQHPHLVLQTPIAYHSDSDLSVLPIDRNGIAICQNCGAIGVKHAFYTRQRRFCSMTCSKQDIAYYKSQKNIKRTPENYNDDDNINHGKKQMNYRFKLMESSEHMAGMIPMQPLPQIPALWQASLDDFMQQTPLKTINVNKSFQWADQLFACDFLAAPVKLFRHAPLSDMWDNVFEGMKVEVKNRDCEKKSQSDYFWVATVLKLKGYMGLLRYEGFGNDDSKDFWINLMHSEVHPVGWCATRGKPLIPPRTIENKHPDWKSFLVRQLTGARTLPADFYNKITESLRSRFRASHTLEVVDKNRISQVKVATVQGIVGKRLHVRYYDSGPDDDGFWCHEDSPLIHPVGWARAVGHHLDAPRDYSDRLDTGIPHPDDATADLFRYYLNKDPHDIDFEPNFVEGMKIEAIDHLNLSSVCVATVMRVLLHGHIMIRIDCYPADETGSDWFCYHERSPCIFPAGFCAQRGIPLTLAVGQPPLVTSPCPSTLPPLPPHGFISGMRLECADLMDPRLVCVARVSRVVGRLIKVHFDGWGDEYDQWLDCESTDIYPVGWCGAVSHRLEAPFVPAKPPASVFKKRGRKKKTVKMQTENYKPSLVNPTSEALGTSNYLEVLKSHSPSAKDDVLCENFIPHSADLEDFQSTSNMDSIMNLESTPDIDDIEDVMKLQSSSDLDDIMKLESASDIDDIMKLDSVGDMNGVKHQPPHLDDEVDKLESPKMHSLDTMIDNAHTNDIILDDNLDFDITDIDDKPVFDNIESKHCSDNGMDIADEPLDGIDLGEPEAGITTVIPKVIPRLVGNFSVDSSLLNAVDPESWDPEDVARFLSTNDCAPYCQNFSQITGKVMLELTKDEIIELLQMKVGPSLKIFDLIQQLKCKLKPAQARIKSFK